MSRVQCFLMIESIECIFVFLTDNFYCSGSFGEDKVIVLLEEIGKVAIINLLIFHEFICNCRSSIDKAEGIIDKVH
jgi:hypothetical protein